MLYVGARDAVLALDVGQKDAIALRSKVNEKIEYLCIHKEEISHFSWADESEHSAQCTLMFKTEGAR